MIDAVTATPLARAIGLALVDFLWQGAAIGALTALVLVALRRSSAQARYIMACAGLALMLAAPIVTAARTLRTAPLPSTSAAPATVTAVTLAEVTPAAAGGAPSTPIADSAPIGRMESWLPAILSIWSAGVLVLALRLLRSWLRVTRLRRGATALSSAPWPATVRSIAARLGVTRPLALVQSALVHVPAVVGWIRPVIVVPASALAGLPPAQLEAILVHEIAHIRRADYLVNVVQCLVEILLFYHPAVWWVSRQVRIERELCCDDIAAAVCGDRVAYARALASLEELQPQAASLAVAANGGDLLHRVRRLVDPASASGPKLSGGVAMGVVLTIVLLALGGQVESKPAAADQAVPVTPVTTPVPTVTTTTPVVPVENVKVVTTRTTPVATTTKVVPLENVKVVTTRATTPVTTTGVENVTLVTSDVIVTTPIVVTQQTGRGRILGRVTDVDGGVIPGATVTIVSPANGGGRGGSTPGLTITNASGMFAFEQLDPGPYALSIAIAGFKTKRVRVQVVINQEVTALVRLDIGDLRETVHIHAERPASAPAATGVVTRTPAASQLFDEAKRLYEQGRFAEAEELTARALDAVRTASVQTAPPLPPPPAGTTLAEQPLRVGGSIREPRKIRDVKPIYPAEALAAGVEGTVMLEATIAQDGSVFSVTIMKSVPMLDAAAIAAVRQWRFTPTLLNNVAVPVNMVVTITFEAR